MAATIKKPRFVADQMLGNLAKWLRLLGFDTSYYHTIDHARLLRIARDEHRVLLTSDTQLLKTRPVIKDQISAVMIRQECLDNQLIQLIEEFDLDKTGFYQPLCPKCNIRLEEVPRKDVRGHVPSYVYRIHNDFTFCSQCNHYYWRGTHWNNIKTRIKDIVEPHS